MIEISKLSRRYSVRRLREADAEEILRLCKANTQFYEYCGAEASVEQIRNDLRITPPGVDISSKYYVGFYQGRELVAVMDLIDGYPDAQTAFIGFFMMNKAYQGRQIGSGIIGEVAEYLNSVGITAIRLGIDKGNPQSTHFWKKNGFAVFREVERDDWTILIAEKRLA